MSIPTTAVARYQPVLSDVERMTMLGFLAGYRGFTRDAYALDLRQFTTWCWQHDQRLFDVRRVEIECFARDLEDRGKARATVARRLCTIVGFRRDARGSVDDANNAWDAQLAAHDDRVAVDLAYVERTGGGDEQRGPRRVGVRQR